MQCEKCNSENTQRLQVAYEGGTQNINTVSHSAGAGLGGGAFGVGGATTTTSGVSRSLLASRAAPPAKHGYKYSIFFGFLAFLLFSVSNMFSGLGILSFAVMALCGYFIYAAYTFNSTVWPGQFKYWQAQWLCHRCGHIYHQA